MSLVFAGFKAMYAELTDLLSLDPLASQIYGITRDHLHRLVISFADAIGIGRFLRRRRFSYCDVGDVGRNCVL
jgi:hypothetical protein